MTDCHLCHGPHDPEFHAMNARHHKMLRADVTRYLSVPLPKSGPLHIQKSQEPKPRGIATVPREPKPRPQIQVGVDRGGRPPISALTAEVILERQAKGETIAAIAATFGCCVGLVAKRLRAARKAKTAGYVALRKCPTPGCGKPKWPSRPHCNLCVKKAKLASGDEYSRLREIGKQREAQA